MSLSPEELGVAVRGHQIEKVQFTGRYMELLIKQAPALKSLPLGEVGDFLLPEGQTVADQLASQDKQELQEGEAFQLRGTRKQDGKPAELTVKPYDPASRVRTLAQKIGFFWHEAELKIHQGHRIV